MWGEKGYTTYERTGIRPTLEVNGIWGGYEGEGAKTVLPSKAYAKISARLVPNQSSDKMTEKLLNYFKSIAPPSVTVKAFEHHGGEPYMTPIDSKGYKAAAKAVETTFGKQPIPCSWWWKHSYLFYPGKRTGSKNYFHGLWTG